MAQQPQLPPQFKRTNDLIKEAQKFVNEGVKERMEQWKNQDPARRGHLKIKAMNFAYKPSAVGFFKVLPAIVDRMLMPDGLKLTQKKILAEVQKQFPQGKLNPNLWNRELVPAARSKAQKCIDGNMVTPISVKGCKSLAEIRKRLQANAQPQGEARTFSTKMTFTKERLIVGKKSYAYVLRKSGKKSHFFVHLPSSHKDASERSWVKVGALLQLVKRK